jgi:hypothetical protein
MQKQKLTRKSKITLAIIAGVFIVFLILCDLIGIGGNIRYYATWLQCGTKPVMTNHPFMNVGDYTYSNRPYISWDYYAVNDPYFCNAREAELHGYSATNGSLTLNQISYSELKESYIQNHGRPGYEPLSEMDFLVKYPLESLESKHEQ